jgi:hypothetical protein
VVIAGPGDAVYLPAGWIYCVLTLEGSLLVGLTFTCLEQLETLIRCFGLEADFCHSTADQQPTLLMIADTFEVALQSQNLPDIEHALRVYLRFVDVLVQGKGLRNLKWAVRGINRLTKIVRSYTTKDTATFPVSCPCGTQKLGGITHFRSHFPSRHIPLLENDK